MNTFENWFCGSSLWRLVTERKLLPWILSGYALGDHVLEVGAGPGATTDELLRRAGRVTSLDYDPSFVSKLAKRHRNSNVTVVRGDAAALPFPDHTFSSVIAVLVLHHLKSPEQQNNAFSGDSPGVAAGRNVFRVRDSRRLVASGRPLSQHLCSSFSRCCVRTAYGCGIFAHCGGH